jgi:cytochrome P450
MTKTLQIDMLDPAFKADPYPTYARLRAESPVHPVRLPDGRRAWLVSRYDDAMAALKDPRLVRSWRKVMSPEQLALMPAETKQSRLFEKNMIMSDPPEHTRLRALVQKAFTVSLVEQMRERVQQIADQLLDAVADRGQMDLIDDYAFPLPMLVIAEVLGIPPSDRGRLRTWTEALVPGAFQGKERMERMARSLTEFADYVMRLCEERRRAPAGDLISALVHAEERGDKLNQDELLSMIMLLVVAGHETTVNLLANGMLALFDHPDQLALLQRDPSLVKGAVEELLRYDGPVAMIVTLYASEDVEIGGSIIPKGENAMVLLGSADRDGAGLEAPSMLDVTRPESKHLAFGYGIHYCLGAPLARMEGQIGIATLLRRLPGIRLAVPRASLERRPSPVLRGVRSLPVEFSSRLAESATTP